MATTFRFEHVFRAPSVAAVLAAYFDPDHLAAQDALAGLIDREVIDAHDDAAVRRTSWRVAHAKPLPLFVRPLVSGGRLRLVETMAWRRADDAVDATITPEVLGGRVSIQACYRLTPAGDGQVRRIYEGTITADIRMLGGRIEQAIRSRFEDGMPAMAASTQTWLDQR